MHVLGMIKVERLIDKRRNANNSTVEANYVDYLQDISDFVQESLY